MLTAVFPSTVDLYLKRNRCYGINIVLGYVITVYFILMLFLYSQNPIGFKIFILDDAISKSIHLIS